MYCVGRRMKFRSCNSEPCSKQKKDFREEQCAAFDGRHFNINGLPPNVRWVPKYSGSKNPFFCLANASCSLFFVNLVLLAHSRHDASLTLTSICIKCVSLSLFLRQSWWRTGVSCSAGWQAARPTISSGTGSLMARRADPIPTTSVSRACAGWGS